MKKVYRAFDKCEGVEQDPPQTACFWHDHILRPQTTPLQITLLQSLKNDNIIVLRGFWHDTQENTLNFIIELCTSCSLRNYRKKHCHVSLIAVKNRARQILKGLNYLHPHEPCIIHRDINCNNVFINGDLGEVKIGDIGLAALVRKSRVAHSLLGTPGYMASELYVDIYALGMCLLEMATDEVPYGEYQNVVQIYKKVSLGVKPKAMERVGDEELRVLLISVLGSQGIGPLLLIFSRTSFCL
ncbi:with no lysine (K) kinase 6 [Actinidia rufa]|uniref:non-specific serine/threonine protein kinase n=1 Tax=Actinidia rufa TaxID=165716 RepID=A0A7J0GKI6_9ERIC|nr:with no lysine (K) kinase 6 [Actinidia rufa]